MQGNHLKIYHYPMPKAEVFSTLNGGKKFIKLDFSQVYVRTIALHEES